MENKPEPSSTPVTSEPVVQSTSASKAPSILVIVLGAIALVGMGGIGGYLISNKQSTNSLSQQVSPPQTTPTPVQQLLKPTIPPTANKIVTPPSEIKKEITTPQVKSIPLTSTEGWKTITVSGISFKAPPDLEFKSTDTNGGILVNETGLPIISIHVQNYKGGSRRQEYFENMDYYDCHYIYEEALFGSVKALQIGADMSWCQGGAGAIVAVIGNKLVSVGPYLQYYPETKEIYRLENRDTLVSTLTEN